MAEYGKVMKRFWSHWADLRQIFVLKLGTPVGDAKAFGRASKPLGAV